jgi:hypothetical protein
LGSVTLFSTAFSAAVALAAPANAQPKAARATATRSDGRRVNEALDDFERSEWAGENEEKRGARAFMPA